VAVAGDLAADRGWGAAHGRCHGPDGGALGLHVPDFLAVQQRQVPGIDHLLQCRLGNRNIRCSAAGLGRGNRSSHRLFIVDGRGLRVNQFPLGLDYAVVPQVSRLAVDANGRCCFTPADPGCAQAEELLAFFHRHADTADPGSLGPSKTRIRAAADLLGRFGDAADSLQHGEEFVFLCLRVLPVGPGVLPCPFGQRLGLVDPCVARGGAQPLGDPSQFFDLGGVQQDRMTRVGGRCGSRMAPDHFWFLSVDMSNMGKTTGR